MTTNDRTGMPLLQFAGRSEEERRRKAEATRTRGQRQGIPTGLPSVLDAPVSRAGPTVRSASRSRSLLSPLQGMTVEQLARRMEEETETGRTVTELRDAPPSERTETPVEEPGGILGVPVLGDIVGGAGQAFDWVSTGLRAGAMYPFTTYLSPEGEGPSWGRARDRASAVSWVGKARGIMLNDNNVIVASYTDGTYDVVNAITGVRTTLNAEEIATIGEKKMNRSGLLRHPMGALDVFGGTVQDVLDGLIPLVGGGWENLSPSNFAARASERYYGKRSDILSTDLIDPLMFLPLPGVKTLLKPVQAVRGTKQVIPQTDVAFTAPASIWNNLDIPARSAIVQPLNYAGKRKQGVPTTQKSWDDLSTPERNAIETSIETSPPPKLPWQQTREQYQKANPHRQMPHIYFLVGLLKESSPSRPLFTSPLTL